jgi:hypothetical protein
MELVSYYVLHDLLHQINILAEILCENTQMTVHVPSN